MTQERNQTRRCCAGSLCFYLLVAAYLAVHLQFEYRFWFAPEANLFAKYGKAVEPGAILGIAEKAYLAKSTWLLLTLVLAAFRVPVRLAVGIGGVVYGVEILALFGPVLTGWASLGLALGVIGEWAWERRA